ncbi:MAG TPA: hypothetical protein VNQ90_20440 [Chthoniobacteraceae bacterium]|nr:hypothetical protein [Chthoniobacteraceae bacterium]
MSRPRLFHSRHGLTLLEILVATTISVVVIGLILQMFGSISTLWRRSEERIDTEREARAALDRIRRDLERVVRVPAIPSGDPSPEALHLRAAPEDPSQPGAFEELEALVFLSNQGESDLCSVAYRCVWDTASRSYLLVRSLRDSNATLADLLDDSPTASDEEAGAPAAAASASLAPGEEPLARYVWNLTFRPVVDGIATTASTGAAYHDPLPSAIEIRFNALGSLAVEKLKDFPITEETWKTADDPLYLRLIAPHARAYLLRIPLRAGQQGGSGSPLHDTSINQP